ncbi:MAG: hypothetical protein ACK4OM_04240 [Alphaproteobacteria bacterium]
MPLNKGQKNIIKASINHFFYDLGEEDQDEIQAFINNLKGIFLNDLRNFNKDDLKDFKNLFENPLEYLKNLDQYGSKNFTIADIRKYVIEISDKEIKSAARNVAIIDDNVKKDLGWDKEEILEEVNYLYSNNKNLNLSSKNIFSYAFNKIMNFLLDRESENSQESPDIITNSTENSPAGLRYLLNNSSSNDWVSRANNFNNSGPRL